MALAAIAQLGERQTEDLKVPGSIPGLGIYMLEPGLWERLLEEPRVNVSFLRNRFNLLASLGATFVDVCNQTSQ